jgi:hypothetical protein
MGQDDDLFNAVGKPPYLLNSREGSMFIKTRHGVVNDDDPVGQLGIPIERRKEEGQSERISVACAESIPEGRTVRCS